MEDLPVGSAPSESKYWFLGALISLVPRLNCFGVLEKAAADAVQYGFSERDCRSLHILLISIEHIVLIEAHKNNGHISIGYTRLLPLLAPNCHLSKDIRERYNSVDEVFTPDFHPKPEVGTPDHQTNEVEFNSTASSPEPKKTAGTDKPQNQAKKRESERRQQGHHKKMRIEHHSEAQDSNVGDSAEEANESDEASEEKKSARIAQETFLVLVRFLEASSGPQKGSYPIEIYKMILDEVSDIQTYSACLEASSSLRSLIHGQSNQSLGGLLFFEPISEAMKSDEMLEDLEGCEPDVPIPEDRYSGNVGFRAMRYSSYPQEDLGVHQASFNYTAADFRMVVGHERNRRSFLPNCKIGIRYLDELTTKWTPGKPT